MRLWKRVSNSEKSCWNLDIDSRKGAKTKKYSKSLSLFPLGALA
jgi:hypothetical protein